MQDACIHTNVYMYVRSDFFFKKNYEVICIINFKNTLFKGFTRGDPWAPSLVKQNLNRTQNHEVFTA